jgi:hypothetical protein
MERTGIKKANKNKGQMRIIEVILASFVIVFALSFANMFASSPTSPTYQATELEKLGYNALHDLDDQGLLPRFVYNQEWENLTSALRVLLPLDVYFNATVHDLNGNILNNLPISYGDPSIFASLSNIASVTYGLVGYSRRFNSTYYEATYVPRILTLQLVRGS